MAMRCWMRNARRILTSLVVLCVINVVYVMLKHDWLPDDVMLHDSDSLTSFLQVDHSELACARPKLELWPPEVKNSFKTDLVPIDCNEEADWIYVKNGRFYFNNDVIKAHGEPLCEVTPILRGDDDYTLIKGSRIKPLHNGQNMTSDFADVKCVSSTGKVFTSLLSGVAYSAARHNRAMRAPRDSLNVNILMIGFDSVSRLSWLRNLPRTHEYFTSQLDGVVLNGYNIVGDGTPQALLPILTGRNETELPEARRGYEAAGARTVDAHPWIWRRMRTQGYVTQWAEDGAAFGTFTYRMLGFKQQPVDHYMRTFYLRAEQEYDLHKPYCLGSKPRHLNMLEWSKQLFEMYPHHPKFSFIFHSELSHDDHSRLRLVDADLVAYLRHMKQDGYLNNTVLVMMSDHGARFSAFRSTLQGKYEERLPYMGISLPPSLRHTHAHLYDNLQNNSHKLTTPYDVHEMLLELIGLQGEHKQSARGQSLFTNISETRTCAQAGVQSHWCACLEWTRINPRAKIAKSVAQEVVRVLNSFTKKQRDQCAELKLARILSASVYQPSAHLLNFRQSSDADGRQPEFNAAVTSTDEYYQVVIETQPSGGRYEATVKFAKQRNQLVVNRNAISRINRYARQPWCVQDRLPHLREFCYCRDDTQQQQQQQKRQ